MDRDQLSLYRDARRYDHIASLFFSNSGDLVFYQRQAALCPGPILELACGSGRLTIPLALGGADMTGLDTSPEMLALAREKSIEASCAVIWVQADARDFRLDRRFSLVFIPTNSLLHLHSFQDIEACFACVRDHLAPSGRFIVDIFNPDLAILTRDPNQVFPVIEYDDPDSGRRVVMTQTNRYDAATQINYIEWRLASEGAPDSFINLDARILYPQELEALLAWGGFEIAARYGDYECTPFTSASHRQIFVCRFRG